MGIVLEKAYSEVCLEADQVIGSGLIRWQDKGQQFILEANEDYYGKQPRFSGRWF
ncbi:MAG: hypothetical protein ACLTNO_00880 [Blautia sp.]